MNKKDLPIVILLLALLFLWPHIAAKLFPARPPAQAPGQEQGRPEAAGKTAPEPATADGVQARAAEPVQKSDLEDVPSWLRANEESRHQEDRPQEFLLANPLVTIAVSSWGGGIVSATLKEYPQSNHVDSVPVTLDFSTLSSLTYAGLPGLSTNYDFTVNVTNGSLLVGRTTESGLRFDRTISFAGGYEMKVVDRFTNTGNEPLTLPEHGMRLGPMRNIETGIHGGDGYSYLSIDSQASHGGEKVKHWERKRELSKSFRAPGQPGGFMCYKPPPATRLPLEKHLPVASHTDWIAVKNKFFAQILAPVENATGTGFTMHAKRKIPPVEEKSPQDRNAWARDAILSEVAATMHFPEKQLAPGGSFEREISYYAGPKKYSVLKTMGKDDIMEFGFWAFMCKLLLPTLNYIYRLVPNYGVAIIVLTILIRLLFWPVMKKQTDSMKKMQELQPELQEIREKYKNDQQKLLKKQQELFKKNKVSPMGGCLPILIQIPVFIGLFTVLRSAIELRFAGFLWIRDLSAPEGLLAGILPFPPYQINILPILMTVTTIWQQKLTPSTGDAQQQKMMAIMMPLLLLFMFYNMASALVLYWTTSQCLAIAQLLIKDRLEKRKDQLVTP